MRQIYAPAFAFNKSIIKTVPDQQVFRRRYINRQKKKKDLGYPSFLWEINNYRRSISSHNSNIQETDQLVNQHIDCLIFTFRLAYDKIKSCAKEREEYDNSIVQEIRALFILLWRRTFDHSFRTSGWNQKKGTCWLGILFRKAQSLSDPCVCGRCS